MKVNLRHGIVIEYAPLSVNSSKELWRDKLSLAAQQFRSIKGHLEHGVLYHVNALGALHLVDLSIYNHFKGFRNLNWFPTL